MVFGNDLRDVFCCSTSYDMGAAADSDGSAAVFALFEAARDKTPVGFAAATALTTALVL